MQKEIIIFSTGDDWESIYVDGEFKKSDHSLDYIDLAEVLNIEVKHFYYYVFLKKKKKIIKDFKKKKLIQAGVIQQQ